LNAEGAEVFSANLAERLLDEGVIKVGSPFVR
jgi:hypothetical protein